MNFPEVPDDDFLTGPQACEKLGVNPPRLHKLIRTGQLQIVSNSSGKRGYSQANVEALLASAVDLGPAGPPSTKGLFRRAGRKIMEFGVEGFFQNLGGN